MNIDRRCFPARVPVWGFLLLACVFPALGSCSSRSSQGFDSAWWPETERAQTEHKGLQKTSFYLPMRDGVKIAVDLYLPADLQKGHKIPTLLMQTRYFRSIHLYWPTSSIIGIPKELQQVVEHGYALVRTDVRGTGASFGGQPNPWPPDAVRDGAQIVDWIIAQPWSNGNVGSVGGSYEGTTAEFLLVNNHPAVKAVGPLYALYDVYTDIAFPGGIRLEWFLKIWDRGTLAMDTNRLRIAAWYAPLFTRGVMPVDRDSNRNLLHAAVSQHANNLRVYTEASKITFRDDGVPGRFYMDEFSPHTYRDTIANSKVAIYNYSGWFDGGYPHAAVKRFLTRRGPQDRLTLGPWNHGGGFYVGTRGKTKETGFDHISELMRFFDYHLTGRHTGITAEPPVHYFTLQEEKWKTASTWPPPNAVRTDFYFSEGHALTDKSPSGGGEDEYRTDLKVGTGDKTRWNCLAVDSKTHYGNRAKIDRRLLVYETNVLSKDTEVTGHPVVTIFVKSNASDGEFFAYLEDVDQDGRVGYVTEGMLRAIHRKVSAEPPPYHLTVPYHSFLKKDAIPLEPGQTAEIVFDLLPVSYLFRAGHKIRIALAGADADLFWVMPGEAPIWRVSRGPDHPSRITLPLIPR